MKKQEAVRLGKRVQKFFPNPSKCKPSFKAQQDINTIVKKYLKQSPETLVELAKLRPGQYGDFSQVTDYKSALDRVAKAKDSFLMLPAKLRTQFDNDPAKFLDFMNDPRNLDKQVELGLVQKPVKEEVPSEAKPKA